MKNISLTKFFRALSAGYLCLLFLTACDPSSEQFSTLDIDSVSSSNIDSTSGTDLSATTSSIRIDAISDLTVNAGESVELTTSVNNLDPSTLSYSWEQTSGNEISLADDDNATVSFTTYENDTLEFTVNVIDDDGQEYTDSVTVTVLPADDSLQYSAQLSWIAPTMNEDGSELSNLAGFVIYYGQTETDLDTSVRINDPMETESEINNLYFDQNYYFCVAAYNSSGIESECSDIVMI